MDTPSVDRKILKEFRSQTDCCSRMYRFRVFLDAELHPVADPSVVVSWLDRHSFNIYQYIHTWA